MRDPFYVRFTVLKVATMTTSEIKSGPAQGGSLSIGGSGFYSQVLRHVETLRDPTESFSARCESFTWLRDQYGDWQEVDGPLESAIRTVAEETSEIGRKLQPFRSALECRDTFIRVSALLPKSESARAEALLSPAHDPTERLKALEDLVSFHLTGRSADEQAVSKRALTIIIEGLNREAMRRQGATQTGSAVATAGEQRLHERVTELSLLFSVTSS